MRLTESGAPLSISRQHIQQAVRDLGLAGRPVCVHSSLRSFGSVAGGADAVINGLLDAGCTVLVPAFTEAFMIPPPPGARIERNGMDYPDTAISMPTGAPRYSPESDAIDRDMGAISAAVVRREGRVRGAHPLDSFAAVGPLAGELVAKQTGEDVYAPFRELVARGGGVVMMGVGLTRMTLLHLAEQRAGRELFRRWALDRVDKPVMVAIGACSEGFDAFEPVIGHLARERVVGSSRWRAFPAVEALDLATSAIRGNPEITRCGNPDCERCPDAVLGGPILAPDCPNPS